MADYVVPQDVEADDKLIGPFSFRQFIYLIVVALAGAAAWGLYQLFPLLVVVPLPIIVFFGALALPLRKDQPMETYMAAIVSFYLKPHGRLWTPDGVNSLIEITAPKVTEAPLTKGLSQTEAQQRFGYLAQLVDSGGWSVRGVGVQAPPTAMNTDAYYAAQQTKDVLDDDTPVAQTLDYMIGQSDAKRYDDMMARLNKIAAAPTASPQAPVSQPPAAAATATPAPYNYFAGQPTDDTTSSLAVATAPTVDNSTTPPIAPSVPPVSPDIMNLANNTDLSVETIAHEANRLQKQQEELQDGTVISLR